MFVIVAGTELIQVVPVIQDASKRCTRTKDIVLAAVQEDGLALSFASSTIQNGAYVYAVGMLGTTPISNSVLTRSPQRQATNGNGSNQSGAKV